MAGGRPTDFTEELAEEILARIMEGQSVAELGRADDMPCERTLFRWLAANDEFCQKYARAKWVSADYMAEQLLDIADDGSNDWMERKTKDGKDTYTVLNGEHVQRSRLRVDTRKWLMSKLQPKKYGDKIIQEQTGPGGGPIQYTSLTDDAIDARLAALKEDSQD